MGRLQLPKLPRSRLEQRRPRRRLSAARRAAYIVAATFLCVTSEAVADVGNAAETKARIIAEVAGKQWTGRGYVNTAYTSDRFYVYPLPDEYKAPHQELIDALAGGDFEIIPPTETGSNLDQLPQYLAAKRTCAALPVSLWNGMREISQSEYEGRIYDSVSPYVPNRPRAVDYELQYKGDFTPYASATDDLAFYDLGQFGQNGRLVVFGAKTYEPLPSREPNGFPLQGSFAAFELPHCYFVGTVDYFTHCLAPRATPPWQPDQNLIAAVIRLKGRPFVVTVRRTHCEASSNLPSDLSVILWDVSVEGAVPHVYAYSRRAYE